MQQLNEESLKQICEPCLGKNKFIRMIFNPNGSSCRICKQAYDQYRWKLENNRFKQTVICHQCSQLKNCCQCCLLDLIYHLPIQLRDYYQDKQLNVPKTIQNQNFFFSQQNQLSKDQFKMDELEKQKGVQNNLKICSFNQKSKCTREFCPYSHDNPVNFKQQTVQDRYFADKTDFQVQNLINKHLNNLQQNIPQQQEIKSLVIRNLNLLVTKQFLVDKFSVYDSLKSIKIIQNKRLAFINFTERESAIEAYKGEFDNIEFQGEKLQLEWSDHEDKSRIKKIIKKVILTPSESQDSNI